MWKDRLVRFFLLAAGVVLILLIARPLAEKIGKRPILSEVPEVPKFSAEKLQSESGEVLGKIFKKKSENGESEPDVEPTEEIKEKSQDLTESIKNLPENIREAIKREIMKEICKEICEE